MANDDDASPVSGGFDALFPFGSEPTLASIFGPAFRSVLVGPMLNGQIGDDLFRGPLSPRAYASMAAALPNGPAPSDERHQLPRLTTFPSRRLKRAPLGRRNAWSGGASHLDPEPAEPVLTPLEVVIDSPTFGRMQLGYSPGVDLSRPVALKIDHPRLGVMTLGWIMPAGSPDPYAPTTGVRYEETPFQPPAHWKRGPIGDDEAGGGDGSDGAASDAQKPVLARFGAPPVTPPTASEPPPAPTALPGSAPGFAGAAEAGAAETGAMMVGGGIGGALLGPGVFIGGMVVPTNPSRQRDAVPVPGHPDLKGELVRAPGDLLGTVTLRRHGLGGAVVGTLIQDRDGNLRQDGEGPVLGTLSPYRIDEGIHLTPEGVRLYAPGLTGRKPPVAAGSPPPGGPLQSGFIYEIRNREEQQLVNDLLAQGKSGAEIAKALDDFRLDRNGQKLPPPSQQRVPTDKDGYTIGGAVPIRIRHIIDGDIKRNGKEGVASTPDSAASIQPAPEWLRCYRVRVWMAFMSERLR